jgi:hypothetical protein
LIFVHVFEQEKTLFFLLLRHLRMADLPVPVVTSAVADGRSRLSIEGWIRFSFSGLFVPEHVCMCSTVNSSTQHELQAKLFNPMTCLDKLLTPLVLTSLLNQNKTSLSFGVFV